MDIYNEPNIFFSFFLSGVGCCNQHSHRVVVCRLHIHPICHRGLSGALRSRGLSESLGAWVGYAALRVTSPSLDI
jgi:hypothetical protein